MVAMSEEEKLREALKLLHQAERHINQIAGDWEPSRIACRIREFLDKSGWKPT